MEFANKVRTSNPSLSNDARSFFSMVRLNLRRKRVGRPLVSIFWMTLLSTSLGVETKPGMALSGHWV
jgi:hypothetical protein